MSYHSFKRAGFLIVFCAPLGHFAPRRAFYTRRERHSTSSSTATTKNRETLIEYVRTYVQQAERDIHRETLIEQHSSSTAKAETTAKESETPISPRKTHVERAANKWRPRQFISARRAYDVVGILGTYIPIIAVVTVCEERLRTCITRLPSRKSMSRACTGEVVVIPAKEPCRGIYYLAAKQIPR